MTPAALPTTMNAWRVRRPGPMTTEPVEHVSAPVPEPGPSELLVAVRACGVCRTDLHVTEGDLPVHRENVTPGHEVVGEVVEVGADAGDGFSVGDRVGIAWLRHTCGVCKYCRRGDENLCPKSRYTGWDADGGYAEFATVPAAFAPHLPSGYSDSELAPLLCAGIIGYRSLLRAALPPGGRLGLYGFGGSAPMPAQVAPAAGAEVDVIALGGAAPRRRRPPTGAPRVRDPVRPGRRSGAARAGGARPRRHLGDRRNPPERHSRSQLSAPPFPRTPAALGDVKYPRRRAGLPRLRRRA